MPVAMFPRTKDAPIISVLIPTRGRPEHLAKAVCSCVSLAKDQSRLEFIFKADTDDTPTIEAIARLKAMGLQVQSIVSDRGRGYHDMHLWVNQMAGLAKGDWIFLFNDDAEIKTQNWDDHIANLVFMSPWVGYEDVSLVLVPTMGRPFAQEFFMLRKRTYDVLGHISFSPHNDNWIYSIMLFIGANLISAIQIEHNSHVISDKIREESVEAYKSTILTLNSIGAKLTRLADAEALLLYMWDKEQEAKWAEGVTYPGWHMLRENDMPARSTYVAPDGTCFTPTPQGTLNRMASDIKGQWLLTNREDGSQG